MLQLARGLSVGRRGSLMKYQMDRFINQGLSGRSPTELLLTTRV